MSDELIKKYDHWLKDDSGVAALVIRENLMPVEGQDGVLFPATFAASEDKTFKGGYNIDEFADGKNVCLIDSVGSQANRIEPLFAKKEYAGLVPQIVVKAGDKTVNLLDAGHRAGDAIIRCSALQQDLQDAFKTVQSGDAEPLAKVAPTSLVFGVWDSRDTQAKLPRLIASTIRAFDVRKLTRSAQYVPATEYVDNGLLDEPADKKTKDAYAERGFVHVPASGSHGGVIATGGIRRDATLHLAALRLLTAGDVEAKTLALRRYILGLAMTGFTYSSFGYLRQGCSLVLDPDKPREVREVYCDGRREKVTLEHGDALKYAKAAAKAFGIDPDRKINHQVSPDREVVFDKDLAMKDVSGDDTGRRHQTPRKSVKAGVKVATEPRRSRSGGTKTPRRSKKSK
ncbi:MAG: type I-U CRISPR-associated protein Cas7 [Deltaproteobacteria bacterium]|nr:type I-U CRISPR-associated protein Cas7 [Deltaproteobacteria bacterium]